MNTSHEEVKANLARQIARLTSQLGAMQPDSTKYKATRQIIDATTRALASISPKGE